MEETKFDEQTTDTEQESEGSKQQTFDYRKEREQRLKSKAEKALLVEVGADSLDEIKEKLRALGDYQKQVDELKSEIDKSKVNEYKVEVLKNGFDERFADYIVHELREKASEPEDFKKLLKKFKEENGQFLKSEGKGIKFSTAPDFQSVSTSQSPSEIVNKLNRG